LDEPSVRDFSLAIVAPEQRFDANLDAFLEALVETRSSLAQSSRRFAPGGKLAGIQITNAD
jgi:hypothetical protein